ncbi:conserved hypothetical protein [Theileria orientalis strain Shintoku]|uniref:ENTH domain-containing protein n=1 Tax=Theileria orientalis strain Shintoku TaxID=869250 RepID=J4DNY9_THEOR|nr:conserved hypothetical protein [Theileria orientalis strain Shintoku]BAM39789.1 conserved hypothetical protein [Theileria orientalis strain Shintoku]|eukprot:XP_009690090.1 conserved hypothetical protein [Theileria orientalis strain Shintoku]
MNYSEFVDSLSSSYKNQLSKLTSASSESPPGYIYKELVEYIKTDLSKLNEIEEYIINKLSRKEPFIKIKCLKLLKHLCTNFPKDFIRTKVTQSSAVLECKNYRTPANEYNGEYLSKLVRSEFEQLIKVVCSYDSIGNKTESQQQNKMVGFGNNQYTNQSSNYQAPGGFGNPNLSNPNTSYNANMVNRGVGSYGNPGMMGFGNPNMPRRQSTNSNSFTSFASNFTPTVSELKNAGNNALKMITHAANKYIPSEIRDKLEKVGSAITSTATEQFEKYLGGRSPMGRSASKSLNNSMYNSRGYGSSHPQGFGPTQQGFGGTQGSVNYQPGGGPSAYNPASYSAVGYKPQQHYSQSQYTPQPFANQQPFGPQGYGSMQHTSSATAFSQQQSLSHASSINQGFDPFTKQQSFTPREREVEFVKEMLTFTGIKVSPSPRLIDEYMEKMKELDKKIVVEELLKHLNARSPKWQTHFRILCIFESLFQRGGLDEALVKELKKTATPIFNKCKEEAQLSNKASKLLTMLSSMKGSGVTDEVSEFFGKSDTSGDMLGSNTSASALKRETSADMVQQKEGDPLEGKSEDIFANKSGKANPALVPVGSNLDEFDLFFSNTTSIQESARETKVEQKNPDPFDFDALSFENTGQKTTREVGAPQQSLESISSNIDNNLDLFDNTDFNAELLSARARSQQPQFQAPKPSAGPETFDLL